MRRLSAALAGYVLWAAVLCRDAWQGLLLCDAGTDCLGQYASLDYYAHWSRTALPLWDVLRASGQPFGLEPTSMFGLPYLMTWFVSSQAAAAAALFLSYVLGGFLFYVFMRMNQVRPFAAFAAGTCWVWTAAPGMQSGYFFLPLIFCFAEKYASFGRPRWLWLFGLTAAISGYVLNTGFSEMVYGAFFVWLYLLHRMFNAGIHSWFKAHLLSATPVILGALLAAFHWMRLAELASWSVRAGLPPADATLPYPGLLAIFAVIAVFLHLRKDNAFRFYFGIPIMITAYWCAMPWIIQRVPEMAALWEVLRLEEMQHVFAFCVAALLGYGMHLICAEEEEFGCWKWTAIYAGAGVMLLGGLYAADRWSNWQAAVDFTEPRMRFAAGGALMLMAVLWGVRKRLLGLKVWQALLLCCLIGDIVFWTRPFPPSIDRNAAEIVEAQFFGKDEGLFRTWAMESPDDEGLMNPDVRMLHHIAVAEPGQRVLSRYGWVLGRLTGQPAPDPSWGDFLNIRYLISGMEKTGHESEYPLMKRGPRYQIYRNSDVLPRFYGVPNGIAARNADEAGGEIGEDFDFRRDAVLETRDLLVPTDEAAFESTVRVRRYEPNRIDLEVDFTAPGYLIMSEAYYPDWKARVNRRRAPIYPANIAFRGVPLPAGRSQVALRYRPASLRIGYHLAGIGFLILLLSMLRLRGRPQRRQATSK